jgi:putative effector of murein hydrolase LrgA (UPF0299 family)
MSVASRASKRQGPSHHGQMLLSNLFFMFVPSRPDIGRNWTSASQIGISAAEKSLISQCNQTTASKKHTNNIISAEKKNST